MRHGEPHVANDVSQEVLVHELLAQRICGQANLERMRCSWRREPIRTFPELATSIRLIRHSQWKQIRT